MHLVVNQVHGNIGLKIEKQKWSRQYVTFSNQQKYYFLENKSNLLIE